MKTFKSLLTERFVNLFGRDEQKEKYADEVFAMIQKAYADIGGQKGKGFKSAQDMIANIPFWKLVRKNDKIVAGAMYRDKGGRKRVAVFTDGSTEGKRQLGNIMADDFGRAYFEVSGKSLGFMVKMLGVDFVKKFAKSPSEVEKISGDLVEPIPDDFKDVAVQKFPQLKDFFYQRELGGHMYLKIMLGTNGKKIIMDSDKV